jgi:hypothetical protein
MKLREIYLTQLSLASIFAVVSALTSCSSDLNSSYVGSVSPVPVREKVLAAELAPCTEPVRPLRIAFVIDNTGSNNADPSDVQNPKNTSGTDPVKSFSGQFHLLDNENLNFLDASDVYTDRQVAVFLAIKKLQKASAEARVKNPDFKGIDVGVAHFPFAPAGLARNAPVDESDLAKHVLHNGAATGLPDVMTDVSKIAYSESWRNQIWNMLKFTHTSRGLTPYATAFEAAYKLLVSSEVKKDGDDRPGLMVLITDGLPSDRLPSKIYSARQELGTDTRVAIMSVFQPNANEEQQNKPARDALAKAYDEYDWGKDEYQTFDAYWNALREVPKSPKVRDDELEIESKNLLTSMDELLNRYLKCKSAAD